MRNFWNVFSFTYIQTIKKKSVCLSTCFIILVLAALVNFQNIKQLVVGKETVKVIAVINASNININENLFKYNSKYSFKVLNKNLDSIKRDMQGQNPKYSAALVLSDDLNIFKLYTNDISNNKMINDIGKTLDIMLLKIKSQKISLSSEKLNYLTTQKEIKLIDLVNENKPIDGVKDASASLRGKRLLHVGISCVILSIILFYSAIASSTIIEEKSSRIMETLITATKPINLFIGKVLGTCFVCLTQIFLWLISVFIFTKINNNKFDLLNKFNISLAVAVYCIVFVILAYILYCIMLSGLSSLARNVTDINIGQVIVIFTVPICYLLVIFSFNKPEQLKILSLIPFSAPFGMTARLLISNTVTTVEVFISILLIMITIAVIGYFSSKIFKRGVLRYSGKKSIIKRYVM
ncbi:ABC transporter permease [Clostridium tagluense]|uniref:ABC transporter permease n=1 Tax=Clostridium tagluense TaxID=360422 RepID=UPI001C0B6044|nr:ABC transporter permease [Clostridium tagluense]MBU3130209.1 ABC transporter permease [Clostridium tagluense]